MNKDERYRPRGVKWSIDERPVKFTTPKAYVYDCECCGEEFTMVQEIHIPWCIKCRFKNMERDR